MERKTIGILAALALGLLLTGGVALAKFVACTGGKCVGTESSDTIQGLDSRSTRDEIFGLGSRDNIFANAGDDTVNGNSGDDEIGGGAGGDTLSGNGGNDSIIGDTGQDKMFGGGGNDRVSGIDDPLGRFPAERDEIDCGENPDGSADNDFASVDRLDTVKNCEQVARSQSQ